MIDLELWHNPRCSKSRLAKALLDEAGIRHRVRRYLEAPPAPEHLDRVLVALGLEPWDFARCHESKATDLGLADWCHDRRRWIDALIMYPILIERPVLTTDSGDRAIVARPPGVAVDFALQEQTKRDWLCFDASRWSASELWGMKP